MRQSVKQNVYYNNYSIKIYIVFIVLLSVVEIDVRVLVVFQNYSFTHMIIA